MKKRVLIPPALRRPRLTDGKNGAPFGNRNAFKHGKHTRQRRALLAEIRAFIRHSGKMVDALNSDGVGTDVSGG